MVYYAVSYGFSQKFTSPARDAYDWSVDYRSDDLGRMGKKGSRKVRRLDESTVILEDTTIADGKAIKKTRLVKLFPELLMWTNTRLSEAGRHSQFIYRIIPEGENGSRLEFTGAQVEEAKRKPTPAQVARVAEENRKADSALWVLLAKEMKKDLGVRS